MTRYLISLFLGLLVAGQASAESLVARHTIRSRTVISAADVQVVADQMPGALSKPSDAIGMEARVVLYAGRAIRSQDLTPQAIIERNQIVPLVFQNGSLAISTEGRSLARAAAGERVRVMNLQSRSTVTGTVAPEGHVVVSSNQMKFASMENQR